MKGIRRTLGLYQELESLVNGDRVRGRASASRLLQGLKGRKKRLTKTRWVVARVWPWAGAGRKGF